MTILYNGTFELANGVSRVARVVGEESWSMRQETDSTVYSRAAWRTFFPDRATREITAALAITFPQAADIEEAVQLAHELLTSLPTGGTLEVTEGETTITYAQAVTESAAIERIGIHVALRVTLRCVNPDINEEARAQFESGEFQEFE